MEENKSSFTNFFAWLGGNWLVLAVLVVTATRTYDIVHATSPAGWLPWAGVLIMEGSWFFWNGRTEHARRTAQQAIAWVATGVTWLTIALTVAADAAWQASLRGYFDLSEMPGWADTVAVYSVVLVGMLHLGLFVLYKYIDPLAQLRRKHERDVIALAFQGQKAQLDMTRAEQESELEGWRAIQSQAAKVFGTLTFRTRFHDRYGVYPEDLSKTDLKEMTRLLVSPTAQPTAQLPQPDPAAQAEPKKLTLFTDKGEKKVSLTTNGARPAGAEGGERDSANPTSQRPG